jgi:endogenous inhibitor of DNA gyrase (YacG/DUF329 family)
MTCARCEQQITGTPVTDGDDPLARTWCSPDCRDDDGQAWYEQHYRST